MYVVLVLEMQNDIIYGNLPISCEQARGIIPNIQKILKVARETNCPVVHICLQLYLQDPMFKKIKMPPHCIAGSNGAEVVDELKPEPGDYTVYIPRMDGFFVSNLEFILKEILDVEGVIVTGVSTGIGCFLTAIGAIQRGLGAMLVSDACTTYTEDRHNIAIEFIKKNAGFIRLVTTEEVTKELKAIG